MSLGNSVDLSIDILFPNECIDPIKNTLQMPRVSCLCSSVHHSRTAQGLLDAALSKVAGIDLLKNQ